jgi:hypothetical protein
MSFLCSRLGLIFFCLYVVLAVLARVRDLQTNKYYWMFLDMRSFLVGLPGGLILRLLGYDPERMLIVAMCITAPIAYLTGAAIEQVVRMVWR